MKQRIEHYEGGQDVPKLLYVEEIDVPDPPTKAQRVERLLAEHGLTAKDLTDHLEAEKGRPA